MSGSASIEALQPTAAGLRAADTPSGGMTMIRKTLKLTLAATLVAVGGFATGLAWATPGQGITTTIVSGPIELEPSQIVTESPDHGVIFKTKGTSDIYVVLNKIVPGGHTGWHSHPGPSIISVVSGTATEYRSDSPDPTVYPAGTAFLDEGGDHAHIVGNAGNTDLVLVAFQILPKGAPRRIDEPAP
jgi:quercetin dioxygenase-like cupin family protein